ncbi:Immunoglobulin superfamily member 3 [Folsomia candida]|uniref:Immunoglobulin superfamily member 3 n=1 Tax=Folsomia candida TaxID=158441 RepID=A0A226D0N5_FOLCA|nr:Immunoglobulin superfamily member 3 [Folsomia candida]
MEAFRDALGTVGSGTSEDGRDPKVGNRLLFRIKFSSIKENDAMKFSKIFLPILALLVASLFSVHGAGEQAGKGKEAKWFFPGFWIPLPSLNPSTTTVAPTTTPTTTTT